MKGLLKLLELVLFCGLVIVLLCVISPIFERKESRIRFGGFVEDPAAYDVIFIGDSHTVNGIYPMELYEDYGIASYNLSGIGNTLPVSYWIMQLAMDRMTPKVVVLGVKDVDYVEKLTASSGDLHTSFDVFPLDRLKTQAILDLTDNPLAADDDGNLFSEMRPEYLFPFIKYHARWKELSPADFEPTTSVQKGGTMVVGLSEPREYEITEDVGFENDGYGYAYLRKAIEYCQSRNIPIVLVNVPYPATYNDQVGEHYVKYIAEEYDVPFIDFVYMDYVVDYGTDMYDSFSHLNPSGARKVTDYLGKYLKEHYDLPDWRDKTDSGWGNLYREYVTYKLGHIKNHENDLPTILTLLHDKHLSLCMTISEDAVFYEDERNEQLLQNVVRRHLFEEDEGLEWSDGLWPLSGLDDSVWDGAAYSLIVDRKEDAFIENAENGEEIETSFGRVTFFEDGSISVNDQVYSGNPEAEVRLIIMDEFTGELVAKLSY